MLAQGAWAARLRELRRALVVIASDMVATEPIPERLAELGWHDGLAICDSRMLVNYYRTTRDGRIAFEREFRRILGYRELAKLAVAIERELVAETTAATDEEEAAIVLSA